MQPGEAGGGAAQRAEGGGREEKAMFAGVEAITKIVVNCKRFMLRAKPLCIMVGA